MDADPPPASLAPEAPPAAKPAKKRRGFAAMSADKQREIARQGGRAAHQKGVAHQWTQEEAREAGRKGGKKAHERGAAHRFTSEEARAAGRLGGRTPRAETTPEGENHGQ